MFARRTNSLNSIAMRIGIDARELCGKPTGVGRHLSGLLRAWAADAAASKHTFVLYAHESIPTDMRNAEMRVIPGSPGTVWEQLALPKAAKQDDLDGLADRVSERLALAFGVGRERVAPLVDSLHRALRTWTTGHAADDASVRLTRLENIGIREVRECARH